MVASLLKIISTGLQDERIQFKNSISPGIFYKVFRRSGRFTTQFYRIEFDNIPQFGQTAYFRIRRQGHLVQRLFLVSTLPNLYTAFQKQREAALQVDPSGSLLPVFGWTNSLGHALVQEASIFFANEKLDTLDSRLLEILDEFNTPLEKTTAIDRLIKRNTESFSLQYSTATSDFQYEPYTVIVPLPFWFCKSDPASALPTDAISRDEMRVMIRFRDVNGLYYTDSRNVDNSSTAEGTSLYGLLNSQMYVFSPNASPQPPPVEGLNFSPFVRNVPALKLNGIQSPNVQDLPLGETYILAEYVYLDEPEAVAFRLADQYLPMTQHYALEPVSNRGMSSVSVPLNIGNPVRDLYWMVQRVEAPSYNAHFLATRDLGDMTTLLVPWWPNSRGLHPDRPAYLQPAFAFRDSEPISSVALVYEGSLVRTRSEAPAIYRTIIPALEQKKSPWVNRYYYNYPLAIQNGRTPATRTQGEANLDKMKRRELRLQIAPKTGFFDATVVDSFQVYTYAVTYNILRVYSGRAGLLFAY